MTACLELSLGAFPATASTLHATGLPWGCILRPIDESSNGFRPSSTDVSSAIARCTGCFAYINSLAVFRDTPSASIWTCCICGMENATSGRYKDPNKWRVLSELKSNTVRLNVDVNAYGTSSHPRDHPCFLVFVNLDGPREYVQKIQTSIQAILEALPAGAMFGLVGVQGTTFLLFNLRSTRTHLRRIELSLLATYTHNGDTRMPLADLVAVRELFVLVDTTVRANIAIATESLATLAESAVGVPRQADEREDTCVSDALDALLCLFHSNRTLNICARLIVFTGCDTSDEGTQSPLRPTTSSSPAMGSAVVVNMAAVSAPPSDDHAPLASTTATAAATAASPLRSHSTSSSSALDARIHASEQRFAVLARRSAEAGVSIDVHCIVSARWCTPGGLALSAAARLSERTGGRVRVWTARHDESIAHDVYHEYAAPHAFHGLLRVRTSAGFKSAFGEQRHMHFADPEYPELLHVVGCAPDTAIDCLFLHDSSTPIADIPTMQFAFAYTQTQSRAVARSGSAHTTAVSDVDGPWLQRRLLLVTVRVDSLAHTPVELYASANRSVLLSLLSCHALQQCDRVGRWEARALLTDWLITLCIHYSEAATATASSDGGPPKADTSFSRDRRLQLLPRLIFALLVAPAFSPAECPNRLRALSRALLSAHNLEQLETTLYPRIHVFASSQKGTPTAVVPLSAKALAERTLNDDQCLVVDAWSEVIVLTGPSAVYANSAVATYADLLCRTRRPSPVFSVYAWPLQGWPSHVESLLAPYLIEDSCASFDPPMPDMTAFDAYIRAETVKQVNV